MLSRFTAFALLLLAGPTLATAQEVELTPQYEKGGKLVYDSETVMNQTLTLGRMNNETSVTAFEQRSFEVLDKTDSGTKIKISTPKMQFDLTAAGASLSFDSENPDRQPENALLAPLIEVLKVVSKMEITADVNNSREIDIVKVEAEGLDSLPDQFKSSFEKDRLKSQLEQEFKRYPEDKVKPGDTWTRSEIFDAGQGQYFAFTTTYKYEGRVTEKGQTYDKITSTYTNPKFDIEAGSPLPLTVKSNELSMKGSEGTMLLDPESHHIVKMESKAVYKGKLVFVLTANNMELPGELDLTVEAKLNRKAE